MALFMQPSTLELIQLKIELENLSFQHFAGLCLISFFFFIYLFKMKLSNVMVGTGLSQDSPPLLNRDD